MDAYGPRFPRPEAPEGDLSTDRIEVRSEQPYLVGRALAVLLELDQLVSADGEITDRTFDRWTRWMTHPRKLALWISKDAARLAASARRAHPAAVEALESDLSSILARAEIDTLPARWSDETAGLMTAGLQDQSSWYAYNGLLSARQTLARAMANAKAAAVRLVQSGVSDSEAARRVGLDRMTVLKALGKR